MTSTSDQFLKSKDIVELCKENNVLYQIRILVNKPHCGRLQ